MRHALSRFAFNVVGRVAGWLLRIAGKRGRGAGELGT